jgi:fucose 4-O-acetylase-like acetyltransferase
MSRQYAALRGLAILVVVLNHSIYMVTTYLQRWGYPTPSGLGNSLLTGLSQLGVFAVPTFLFISGCFFAYAARGQRQGFSIKFLWTNLRHLLTPYLIWSVIFYLVIYVNGSKSFTFSGYLKNLIVGYPFNFIPILVFWYLLSPLIARAGKQLSFIIVFFIGIYQIILLNLVYQGIYGFFFPSWMTRLEPYIIRGTLADWGVYFPLGLVLSLYGTSFFTGIRKYRIVFILMTGIFFIIALLNSFSIINCPWAGNVCPLTFVFLLPIIKRESIPLVRFLEEAGKKSYGLYLMNLIVLDVALTTLKLYIPWVFKLQIGLYPILFILAAGIPILTMNVFIRRTNRSIYTFIFG